MVTVIVKVMGAHRIFSRGGQIRGRDESPPVGSRDGFTVGVKPPEADDRL